METPSSIFDEGNSFVVDVFVNCMVLPENRGVMPESCKVFAACGKLDPDRWMQLGWGPLLGRRGAAGIPAFER